MAYARISLSLYDRGPAKVEYRLDRGRRDAGLHSRSRRCQAPTCRRRSATSNGYSAIYYTYMWSLVIAKDLFSRFDRSDLLARGAGAAATGG